MKNYIILIEKTENNYSAYSPDIDGCIAVGATKEEARKNFIKALNIHIEGLKEDGIEVPEPSTSIAYCSEECSGILNVRVKKSTHYFLMQLANQEGVSVSHLVNDAIIEKYLKNNIEQSQMITTNNENFESGLSIKDKQIFELLIKEKSLDDVSEILTIKKQTLNKHLVIILNKLINQYKFWEQNKTKNYCLYTNFDSTNNRLNCFNNMQDYNKL